jgi:hypothetical protein
VADRNYKRVRYGNGGWGLMRWLELVSCCAAVWVLFHYGRKWFMGGW